LILKKPRFSGVRLLHASISRSSTTLIKLCSRVARFVASGLAAGESVIVIATLEHLRELASGLAERAVDLQAAVAENRYITLDAEIALASFMVQIGLTIGVLAISSNISSAAPRQTTDEFECLARWSRCYGRGDKRQRQFGLSTSGSSSVRSMHFQFSVPIPKLVSPNTHRLIRGDLCSAFAGSIRARRIAQLMRVSEASRT
jgi:hypothetical protein